MILASISDRKLLKEWITLEKQFSNNNYNSVGHFNTFDLSRTNVSFQEILFCAPHALNHFRNNKIKIADVSTGSLCQILTENTGQSGLISTCPDEDVTFMGFGREYISRIKNAVDNELMIVDLHGMSDKYDLDICIGTGPNPSPRVDRLVEYLVNDLVEYRISINEPFSALGSHTITNFVQTKLGGDAIQIEIASGLRDLKCNPDKCEVFLSSIIKAFNSYIELSE